ncbi:hypothetical protein WQ54_24790 [Bacillus sp. SA1-12]|uniref:hypothetical protein n=1 Tax=Bacillus sp. SA1-12 TaxID=1455638 RepID=UPI0006270841|nr:hypothetical protein [Bacillus sp. SA1-12]KKI89581.1 hypothetical protein WQ54_24790 [Bacillus sp. SA1-12]
MTQANQFNMMVDKFVNGDTGEEVDGITILIDGKLKQVFDILMEKDPKYTTYPEILRDIIFSGTSQLMESVKDNK